MAITTAIFDAASLTAAVTAHQAEILDILDAGGFHQGAPIEEHMSDNRALACRLHEMEHPAETATDNQLFLIGKIILLMARKRHQQEKASVQAKIKESQATIDRFEQLLE